MMAESVLDVSPNIGMCKVNPTFSVMVEGKNTNEVDNNFFLVTTPIENFKSQFLVNMFPSANRIDQMQTRDDLKRQLTK